MESYVQPQTGKAKSKLPSLPGNSASKKQTQFLAVNSGDSPARESSYESRALDRSIVLWLPERVSSIDTCLSLPGEIATTLHGSDAMPPFTNNQSSTPEVHHGIRNKSKASSSEQFIDDPLQNSFGPETASWLRERFPGLR
jgi:hypothetical protein